VARASVPTTACLKRPLKSQPELPHQVPRTRPSSSPHTSCSTRTRTRVSQTHAKCSDPRVTITPASCYTKSSTPTTATTGKFCNNFEGALSTSAPSPTPSPTTVPKRSRPPPDPTAHPSSNTLFKPPPPKRPAHASDQPLSRPLWLHIPRTLVHLGTKFQHLEMRPTSSNPHALAAHRHTLTLVQDQSSFHLSCMVSAVACITTAIAASVAYLLPYNHRYHDRASWFRAAEAPPQIPPLLLLRGRPRRLRLPTRWLDHHASFRTCARGPRLLRDAVWITPRA
jgi:hypothetical protein